MCEIVNYDFTNPKLRYNARTTTFFNSSKPRMEHYEYIYNYNEVQIEVDDVTQ